MCEACGFPLWSRRARLMLAEPDRFGYAEETLRGIAAWTMENCHVTPAQIRALEHVRQGAQGGHGPDWSELDPPSLTGASRPRRGRLIWG